MKSSKSSNPQTFGEIISIIEDAIACCCTPMRRGAASQGMSGASYGAGQVSFLGDSDRGRSRDPPDAVITSGASTHRLITNDKWSNETVHALDIETARGFTEAASRLLNLLLRTGTLPEAGITIAIDTHLIPSHGHAAEPGMPCQGGQDMDPFEQYVTVQRIDAGPRLFLGARQSPASEPVGGTVRDLVRSCQDEGMRIRMVLLDRGFFTTGVVAALDSLRVNYLMPCGNAPGMARTINGFATGRRGGASGNSMNGTSCVPTRHALIIEQPTGFVDKHAAFATNVPGIDANKHYSKWGVEAGHAVVEGIMDKMRNSTQPGLACFLRALMVFNGWTMIDTLQSHRMRTSQGSRPGTVRITPKLRLSPAMRPDCYRPSYRS